MTRRLLLAGTAGSLVAPIVAWVGFLATSAIALIPRGQAVGEVADGARHFFWFFVIIGTPIAFVVSVLAIPFVDEARSARGLTRGAALGWGAIMGGVASALVWGLMFGPMFGLLQAPSGVVAGAVMAWIVWQFGWQPDVRDAAA